MKYVILADSSVGFETPRQLTKIKGEPIIKRTIRLLKENNAKNIIITSHDPRFDNLGAKRYEPLNNDYVPNQSGYWLSAFPVELLNEPITFLFGDCYYSEDAIKTIVNEENESVLFFCSYGNHSIYYIKHHDEPFAFKVKDYNLFKKHIEIVKKMKDDGLCCREPITWELYRSINGQDVNIHQMTKNYVVINDESCDIDCLKDIKLLTNTLGGDKMIKVEAIGNFTLNDYKKLKNIVRKNKDVEGSLFVGDVFECDENMAKYLTGNNYANKCVVKILEVIPEEKKEEPKKEVKEEIKEEKPKATKKKNRKKGDK